MRLAIEVNIVQPMLCTPACDVVRDVDDCNCGPPSFAVHEIQGLLLKGFCDHSVGPFSNGRTPIRGSNLFPVLWEDGNIYPVVVLFLAKSNTRETKDVSAVSVERSSSRLNHGSNSSRHGGRCLGWARLVSEHSSNAE